MDEKPSINRRNCSPHEATRYKSLNFLIIVLKNELPWSEKKARLKMRLETFSIRFFMGNRKISFQLRVSSFTLPRFQILARRSLFSTAMLFLVK